MPVTPRASYEPHYQAYDVAAWSSMGVPGIYRWHEGQYSFNKAEYVTENAENGSFGSAEVAAENTSFSCTFSQAETTGFGKTETAAENNSFGYHFSVAEVAAESYCFDHLQLICDSSATQLQLNPRLIHKPGASANETIQNTHLDATLSTFEVAWKWMPAANCGFV
ncbi:hypothetical protein B0H19DRAFT_1060252 [Mycena capillaripes]|nr:hypothetical protein B0H19DRAFT_1060252 [Mycena capillaripes]